MKQQKVRAVEEYCPHGWKGQILVTVENRQPEWATISSSPLFKTPLAAISWANKWANE